MANGKLNYSIYQTRPPLDPFAKTFPESGLVVF